MKAAVIVFPGSNRDRDMIEALTRTTGRPPLTVWHRDTEFGEVDLIVIPGGFTYGDYLRAGAMATHSPVMGEVRRRAEAGVPTLGVCNGFQILTEAGMLPGALMRNAGLQFVCRDVHIRVEDSQSPFTGGYEAGQVLRVPVAHQDGNYFADPETLDRLEDEGRVAFRYTTPQGEVTDRANPNGSARNIAGIFNESKTVLGLMPHPENATEALIGGIDGQALFENLANVL